MELSHRWVGIRSESPLEIWGGGKVLGLSLGLMVTWEPEKRRRWPRGTPTPEREPAKNPGAEQPGRQRKSKGRGV